MLVGVRLPPSAPPGVYWTGRWWKARTLSSDSLVTRLKVVAERQSPSNGSSTSPTLLVATPATNIFRMSLFTSGWGRW